MLTRPIEKVPWTIQQTFQGVFFTLVPWLLFSFGLSFLSGNMPQPTHLSPQADTINAVVTLVFALVGEGIFLIAPFYFARRAALVTSAPERSLWSVLGFRRFRFWRTLPWLILFFVAILLINDVYQYLINAFHLHLQTNDQVILQRAKIAPISTYATLLAAVIVAPICEEVFFRSFTFMGLQQGMSVTVSIILSALIFAVAHGDPGSFAVLVCIGLTLAFLRWHTQSIWPGIILHMVNNGASALVIILILQGVIKA